MRILALLLLLQTLSASAQKEFRGDTILMGVSFNLGIVHTDPVFANAAIKAGFEEVSRIEKLISSWDEHSQTSEVNRNAGIRPVQVDRELYELIVRSKKIAELSKGHFDISFSSIHKVWDFEQFDQKSIPSDAELKKSVQLIDYKRIILNPDSSTVFLKDKGMRIGFGAIGKGYAANKVKALMQEMGIYNGLINAGGDLIAWGKKPNDVPWTVGLTDPFDKSKALAKLEAKDVAIVTSGNYEKYIELDGNRYCHIINPKTGWPVENLASVTVISPDAEFADAMATTVFVLGREEGLKLIDHLDGVECWIIDSNGDHYLSAKLKANYWINAETDR